VYFSTPSRFTAGEIVPCVLWVEGLVRSGDRLDAAQMRKISCPYRESKSDSSVVQPVALSMNSDFDCITTLGLEWRMQLSVTFRVQSNYFMVVTE
jgi:hypothetical protein